MKSFIRIFCAAIAAVASVSCGSLSKMSDEEAQALNNAVLNDDFIIAVNHVDAMKMPGISSRFHDVYYLHFKNGEIDGTLPYFGEVHGMAPINPDESGINYEHTKVPFHLDENTSKGCYLMDFTAKIASGTWRSIITIYKNGTVDIRMTNTDRDPISYRGNIELPKD